MRSKRDKRYTNLYVKRQLMQLEIDVFQFMIKSYADRGTKNSIMTSVKNRIRYISVLLGLSAQESNMIYVRFLKRYESLVHGSASKHSPEAIYRSIRSTVMHDDLIKDANRSMYMIEEREKENELHDLLESWTSSPFFLASSHPAPAHDHAAWEGKIYYDKMWRSKMDVTNPAYESIKNYIRTRRLRSVQWVTSAPVYFIRRPNCKHFFRNITVDEALSCITREDRAVLLDQKRMIHDSDASCTRARLYYRIYYNRLKILEKLQDTVPCKMLRYDILTTRRLLDKWKNMM